MDGDGWDRPFVGQGIYLLHGYHNYRYEQSGLMVMVGPTVRWPKESTYCMGTITTGTRTEQMDGDGWDRPFVGQRNLPTA
jgi:hypothetical protein